MHLIAGNSTNKTLQQRLISIVTRPVTVSLCPSTTVNVIGAAGLDGVRQGSLLRQTAADLQSLFPLSGNKLTHVCTQTTHLDISSTWTVRSLIIIYTSSLLALG